MSESSELRIAPLLDISGHHGAVWPWADDSARRRYTLRDDLFSELTGLAIALCPIREWEFPQDSSLPATLRRRLDLFVDDPQFAPRALGYNVSAISPHSTPHSRASSSDPSVLLSQADKVKKGRFQALRNDLAIDFHPNAFDGYGSVGPGTEAGLHRVSGYMASRAKGLALYQNANVSYLFSVLWFSNALRLLLIAGMCNAIRSGDIVQICHYILSLESRYFPKLYQSPLRRMLTVIDANWEPSYPTSEFYYDKGEKGVNLL